MYVLLYETGRYMKHFFRQVQADRLRWYPWFIVFVFVLYVFLCIFPYVYFKLYTLTSDDIVHGKALQATTIPLLIRVFWMLFVIMAPGFMAWLVGGVVRSVWSLRKSISTRSLLYALGIILLTGLVFWFHTSSYGGLKVFTWISYTNMYQ
jgi:hypothetical protein